MLWRIDGYSIITSSTEKIQSRSLVKELGTFMLGTKDLELSKNYAGTAPTRGIQEVAGTKGCYLLRGTSIKEVTFEPERIGKVVEELNGSKSRV